MIYLLMEDTDQTIRSQHDPKAYTTDEEVAKAWVAETYDPNKHELLQKRKYMRVPEVNEEVPFKATNEGAGDGLWY